MPKQVSTKGVAYYNVNQIISAFDFVFISSIYYTLHINTTYDYKFKSLTIHKDFYNKLSLQLLSSLYISVEYTLSSVRPSSRVEQPICKVLQVEFILICIQSNMIVDGLAVDDIAHVMGPAADV